MTPRIILPIVACLAAGAVGSGAVHAPAPAKKTPAPKSLPSKAEPSLKTSPTVRRWMRAMTLREEVAQLVFVPFYGTSPNTRSREYRKFVRLVRDTRVGGLVLVNWANGRTTQKAEPYALGAFLNRTQRLAKVPLMVSADFERGASMRVNDTTPFPHAMAFGAAGNPDLARYEGEVTAREARALGVHWVFFPVADVNNNPGNPVINTRSYGEDPQNVAALVKAFIEGAHEDKKNYVLTTAKHFPGHGDTAVDTHLNLATIDASRERLEQLELVPFRAAIDAGVDSIMTAHIAVPALAPADLPATLAPQILTGLLRNDLNFKGIVVTDALEMGSIAKGYNSGEAAVLSLEAGADVLLMPPDPDAAIRAVTAAVESGRIPRKRVEESVARILAAKERAGLDKSRTVNLEAIGDVVNSPEANDKAQEIADRAVTLVRNMPQVLPLAEPERACYVVMAEGRYSSEGQVFSQELRKRAPKALLAMLDPSMSPEAADNAISRLTACDNYAIAAYSSAGAYLGILGLNGELPRITNQLIDSGKPVILVALGNPYLLRDFPNVSAYLATFSTTTTSETAAVRALFGEIAIDGHLPVSIPELAQLGDGIQ
ncbi:MAG: glycoside hydrolase family 3 C-terminal domain-containing protein, partial [Acidobacteriia bacterium]|nr:glycoside hydrolase family 3 C-terminal domain-containing protein [Terriglobia bacterium]